MSLTDVLTLLVAIGGALAIIAVGFNRQLNAQIKTVHDEIQQGYTEALAIKDKTIADLETRVADLKADLSAEQGESAQYKEAWGSASQIAERAQDSLKLREEEWLRQETRYKAEVERLRANFDTMAAYVRAYDNESAWRNQMKSLSERLLNVLDTLKDKPT